MARVRANGVDLNYKIEGAGPWLTLSHALTCDLSMWDEQVVALAGRFSVLRYDSRGHGGSSLPPGPYTFADEVGDVLGLLDALNIARTHFVGLSMGGMIAQHLALTAPQRVDRLVLASTWSRSVPGMSEVIEQRIGIARHQGMAALVEPTLARWFTEPWRLETPRQMERIGGLIRNTALEGYAASARMVCTMDTQDSLGRIRNPILVAVGDQDAGATPALAELMVTAIPGARLEMLPQASHLLNIEQAQLFNALLAQFLS